MKSYRFLSIGLLLAAGCSTTSPFATTTQPPVPLGAQMIHNSNRATNRSTPNQPSPLAGGQQFTQSGPHSYQQAPAKPDNPFLASFRKTTASIGNAFTIEPRVISATDPTSLANQPKNIGADLHFQAAQVYEGQKNLPGAILHFQKALEKSPRDPKILVAFGRLYDRQGDLKTAEGLYQQALRFDPQNCAALNAVGILYAKQGNLDLSLTHLSLAAQLQPQNTRYKNNMANVLADAGRLDEAYAQLASVHGEPVAHYNLGYLLLQQGKQNEARRELALALQANPYLTQAQKLLNSLAPTPGPVGPTNVAIEVQAPGRYSVSQPVNSQVANPTVNTTQAGAFDITPSAGPQSLPPL